VARLDTVITITAVTVDGITVASNVTAVLTRDTISLTEHTAASRAFADVGGTERFTARITVGHVFMTV
jgi:hypothetical protein